MTDRFGYGEIGLDITPRHPCEGCRDYDAPDGCKSNGGCGKPQTNADRIRGMSDEELAAWYCHGRDCRGCEFGASDGCHLGEWLKAPADKEGEG